MRRPQYKLLIATGGVLLFGIASLAVWEISTQNARNDTPRTSVTVGTVEQLVAVSGVIHTDTTGHLGFPANGAIRSLPVSEGERVASGDILATLETSTIDRELEEARASLQNAVAAQQELLAGPTDESRTVFETTVTMAEQQLERTMVEQERLVQNARRTLLSTDLVAEPLDPEEDAPAPTVRGTYQCESTGSYQISIYRSNADSGYSMRVSGLETDTVPVSFTQAVPFGDCGLRITFTEAGRYSNTEWNIDVPNTASEYYIANQNALESATITADNAITAAEESLLLARQQRDLDTAPTRSEQRAQADALIAQTEARIAALETRRQDHILRAPYAGRVTTIDAVVGETVSGSPILTLLGDTDNYELRTRIPEVDIAKVTEGQTAHIHFDAKRDEPQTGTVTYLSPLPTDIDGVAYFEARIRLDEHPEWIRSGLNADVDIVVERRTDVPRLPASYITYTNDRTATVQLHQNDNVSSHTITVPFIGTDGYAVVEGLEPGDTVLAP